MEKETVKLLCTDSRNEDGSDIVKEFDIKYAQAILDVKHPQRGWRLQDSNYTLVKGVITAVQIN